MRKTAGSFDSRQELVGGNYEIQHKMDTGLQGVALHHHDFYEIYFLISGEVTYQIEERRYRVFPGNLLLISPRELHSLSISTGEEPYERYVLWIRAAEVKRISSSDCDLEVGLNFAPRGYSNLLHLNGEQQSTLRLCLETLYQETASEDYGSQLLLESCLRHVLILIGRIRSQSADSRQPVQDGITEQVLGYLTDHYQENFSLDMLAQRFFISKYHLCHEFQQQMGISIFHYLKKKRLQMAKELLQRGKSPGVAGAQVGFHDYSCFYRAFVSEYGLPPGNYVAGLQKIRESY